MENTLHKKLSALMEKGLLELKKYPLQDQSLILVLGASGVGKSTCVNYLKGCTMWEETDPFTGETSIQAEEPLAEIGTSSLSKTLVPKVFPLEDMGCSLCDCPGFFDNRGPEYSITGMALLKKTVNASKSVKGFVIIIDYPSLLDARYVLLNETAQFLKQMLGDYHKFKSGILFLISKVPKTAAITIESTITDSRIRTILMKIKESIQSAENKNTLGDLTYLLDVMLSRKDSVTIINPLDGACQKLQQKIQALAIQTPAPEDIKREIHISLPSETSIHVHAALREIRQAVEDRLVLFKNGLAQDLSSRISIHNRKEDGDYYRKSYETLLQQLKKENTMANLKEFLSLCPYGSPDGRMALLSQIEILLELDAYCPDFSMNLVNQSILGSFQEVFGRELDRLHIISTSFEETEQEKKKLDTSAYRMEKLREQTFLKEDMIKGKTVKTLYLYLSVPEIYSRELLTVISEYQLKDIHTVYIYGNSHIILDQSFEKAVFSGKNLILIGRKLTVPKGRYEINVSGLHASEKSGSPNKNALCASPSGDILLSFQEVEQNGSLYLYADGGNGGNGADGIAGVKGSTGSPGKDADASSHAAGKEFYSTDKYEYYKIEAETGGCGGCGGDGGDGEDAGAGSWNGAIYFYGSTDCLKPNAHAVPSRHGKPGSGGRPGQKGDGGRGGRRGILVKELVPQYGPYGSEGYYTIDSRYLPDMYITPEKETFDGGSALDALYQKDSQIEQHLGSRYADSGPNGTAEGAPGKAGREMGDDDYIQPQYPIQIEAFLHDILTQYAFPEIGGKTCACDLDFIEQTGLLEAGSMTSGQVYEILSCIEDIEKELPKGTAAISSTGRARFYMEARDVCQILYHKILSSGRISRDDQGEWSFLLFALDQKTAFYSQMMEDGGIGGNRVIDISLLSGSIRRILDDYKQGKKEELKQTYFQEFQSNIENQMASGKKQMARLKEEAQANTRSIGKNIDALAEELIRLKKEEQVSIDQLKEKQSELERQLKFKLAWTCISGVLDVLLSSNALGQAFLGFKDAGSALAQSMQDNQNNINELTRTIDFEAHENTLQGITFPTSDQDPSRPRLGETFREDMVSAITWMKEPTNLALLQTRAAEHNLASGNLEPVLAQQESYFSSGSGQTYEEMKTQFFSQISESEKPVYEQTFQWLETEQYNTMRKMYIKNNQADKLEALNRTKELLAGNASRLKWKKGIQIVSSTVSMATATAKCAISYIDTKNNYEAKIKEIKDAIERKESNIQNLAKLHDDITAFKNGTYAEQVVPFVENFDQKILAQDVFENAFSKLELTRKLKQLKNYFSSIELKVSGEIAALFEEMELILDTQIEIAEKIDARKQQSAMGRLIYDLSKDQPIVWSEEQKQLKKKMELNHIQYLCLLEAAAFRLQQFPFHNSVNEILCNYPVSSADSEADILKTAENQNDTIQRLQEEGRYQWLKENSYILQKTFRGSLGKENRKEPCYALHTCTMEERQKLLAGDEITFSVPVNPNYDALKYVTIYANLQGIRDYMKESGRDSDIRVRMHFHGNGQYSLYHELEDQYYCYEFPQNYIEIAHGIELMAADTNDAYAINSAEEDKGLYKFKKSGIDSGRSPYSKVTVSLEWTGGSRKLSYGRLSGTQIGQWESCFPGKASQSFAGALKKLRAMNWINEKDVLVKSWSKIKEQSSQEELLRSFDVPQACLLEHILYAQTSLFDGATPAFDIEFVGFGIYVSRSFLKKHPGILDGYQNNLARVMVRPAD